MRLFFVEAVQTHTQISGVAKPQVNLYAIFFQSVNSNACGSKELKRIFICF